MERRTCVLFLGGLTMSQSFKVGDVVRVPGNAHGTVWESGVIECIKDGRAYLLYGVTDLNDFTGLRGMCTGELLENLEMI
jgi:hypothetical protein